MHTVVSVLPPLTTLPTCLLPGDLAPWHGVKPRQLSGPWQAMGEDASSTNQVFLSGSLMACREGVSSPHPTSLHLHSPSRLAKRLSVCDEALLCLPLIRARWLDGAAGALITEANNRTGKVGSQQQAALQPTVSPRVPGYARRTLMGTFTWGRRLPPNLLVLSHARTSLTAFLASSQGCSSPQSHAGLETQALLANTLTSWGTHGRGFASHPPGVQLSWSCCRAGVATTSHLLCPSAPKQGVTCQNHSQRMPPTWTDRPRMMEMPNLVCCIPSPFPSVPLPRDMGMDYSLLRHPSSYAGWVWPTGTPFPWASLCS